MNNIVVRVYLFLVRILNVVLFCKKVWKCFKMFYIELLCDFMYYYKKNK